MLALASSSTMTCSIRFAAIAFQIRPLGPRKHVPIHMPQIVARRVRAVFRKLLAEAKIRRAVQSRHKSVHNRLRHQIQAGDLGQNAGSRKRFVIAAGTLISSTLSSRRGLPIEQAPQEIVRRQPVRFGMEIQQNAMPQDRASPARAYLHRKRESGRASAPALCRPAPGTAPRARWRRN